MQHPTGRRIDRYVSDAHVSHPRRELLLRAALASAAVNGFVLLDHFAVVPLYDRGFVQGLLSHINATAAMVRLPGMIPASLFVGPSYWAALLLFNLVAYFILFAVVFRLWRWVCAAPRAGPESAVGSTTRRRFLIGVTGAVAASAGATGAYSLFVEPRAYAVKRYSLPIADLPPELDGLTVAQLTDLHHCDWIPIPYIRDVIRTTNSLNPDLVVLTGDYVRSSAVYVRPVIAELARLRPRIGTVAILGNHDWWENGPLTRRLLGEAGIPTLDNARLILTPNRRIVTEADRGLALAGVGDLWCDRLDYHAALARLPHQMPRLLLSHNPGVAEEQAFLSAAHRVDLMLSGHTHGGQVWLPALGAPMTPSRYGTKYARGLVQAPTTRVFISPGIGISGLPLRLAAPPEISLLTLRRAT